MRQALLTKDVIDNEIQFFDLASIDWTKFEFKKGFKPYYLTQADVDRGWLVSYAFFGTTDYEDILWLINGIVNPFELKAGQLLKIPELIDIGDFIYDNSQNRLNK